MCIYPIYDQIVCISVWTFPVCALRELIRGRPLVLGMSVCFYSFLAVFIGGGRCYLPLDSHCLWALLLDILAYHHRPIGPVPFQTLSFPPLFTCLAYSNDRFFAYSLGRLESISFMPLSCLKETILMFLVLIGAEHSTVLFLFL